MNWRVHLHLFRTLSFLSFLGIFGGSALLFWALAAYDLSPVVLMVLFFGLVFGIGYLPNLLLMHLWRPRCPDCGEKLRVDDKDPRWFSWGDDNGPVNYHCDCGFEFTDL